jgi:zona occludens toxin (predicted ATPase)
MIEMLEGVPGSGKSYHAVAEKFLPWVRQGRRIYIYVDGIYLDRLALFEGLPLEQLERQITVWWTKDEVLKSLPTVEPGSAVILDEVQTIFRAKEKQDPEILRWLETHRHRGIDIVMMCQHASQCTLGVIRLVEATTKFRRLDRFGFKGRYQAAVRGNPEETEVIRMFVGRYEPKTYAYYSSYSSAAIKETARGGSIMKSPTVILGSIGLLGSILWFGWGGWLTGANQTSSQAGPARMAQALEPSTAIHPLQIQPVPSPPVTPIRVQGGMQLDESDPDSWLWVTESGELLTETELAGRSGGTVTSRIVRGVRVLSGTGIIWGGIPSAVPPTVPEWPAHTDEKPVDPGPSEPFKPNGVDLLKTPPSLL